MHIYILEKSKDDYVVARGNTKGLTRMAVAEEKKDPSWRNTSAVTCTEIPVNGFTGVIISHQKARE